MSAQHTPGPWVAVDVTSQGTMIYRRIDTVDGKHVGFAAAYKMRDQGEAEANARLFVEAPAMLEALRKGLALYERELLHLIPSKDAKAFIDKTRAILARIEGAEA